MGPLGFTVRLKVPQSSYQPCCVGDLCRLGLVTTTTNQWPVTSGHWNDDFADAMLEVYADNSEDLDVVTLFCEAIMNRTPWQLWDLKTGEHAGRWDGNRIFIEQPGSSTHEFFSR